MIQVEGSFRAVTKDQKNPIMHRGRPNRDETKRREGHTLLLQTSRAALVLVRPLAVVTQALHTTQPLHVRRNRRASRVRT